jgi:hypothetical protein
MAQNINCGGKKLQIKKFDMSTLCEHSTIGLIAKRASGKSWITRDILFHKRKLPVTIIVSQTEKLNKFYSSFVPESFIYNEFNTSLLHKIFVRQANMNQENELRVKLGKEPKDDRLMLIMDDCMSSNGQWAKDDTIRDMFFNGRHSHLSFVITLQYVKGIPPDLRSNFDYIFLLAEDFTNNRKKLYDEYAGMFPSFDVFTQVFTQLTSNFGCMVIDNRIHTTVIEDKVFWYKAREIDDFHVGSKEYKKYHKKNYDSAWNKRIPVFDINGLAKKKNFNNVVVEKIK